MATLDQSPTAASGTDASLPAEVDVLVAGGGFSGLGMAIRLRQEGYGDFVVLERGEEVGGTWSDNTYPGCACDVPSHLYSFSFAPNPDWTRTYSKQPEIREYLHRCADDFGVSDRIYTSCEVTEATWREDEQRWEIETSRGSLRARAFIAAMGPLSEPKIPSLPGLDRFEGAVFHSARWDHEHDLTGERVASIGTGASAIQFVPEIQKVAKQVYVFQRTPPWVFPHPDRPISDFERRLYRRFPALQKLVRAGIYSARETNVLGFVKNPKILRVAEALGKWKIRREIPDPELREKVTPNYPAGCKRILPSNKWYPALAKPNVDLIPCGVEEVRAHSVVDGDGNEYEVDSIVMGTGFNVFDLPIAKLTHGREGRVLQDFYNGSPRNHLGTTVPGFPNFFMLLGPNTGLGHNSMIYMAESQIEHVLGILRLVRERGADSIEPREEAWRRYNDDLDSRMEGTVWTAGCGSWYIDDQGRNSALWPDWTFEFRRRAKRFDVADFVLGEVSARDGGEPGDAPGSPRRSARAQAG